uniref:exodeoxyribonuclease III n=1 Tax=Astatotilapia calliptera TaxID=8154 RepID=A0AAX7TFU5_ASTCA
MQDNGKVKNMDLTFCTWNVKGVNEPVKRGKVLSYLKSLNVDIIFLQETHLKNVAHNKLKCRWINQVYYSTLSAKTRGVAILIKKDTPFKHNSTIVDKNGRYVLVTGELHTTPITLLNIYGPNHDDP